MRDNKLYLILIATVLVAAAMIAVFLNREPHYNWHETFYSDQDQPYDLSLFRTVIQASATEGKFEVVNFIPRDTSLLQRSGSSLIYVDGQAYFDSAEVEALLRFVDRGNNLFVSATNAHRLLNTLVGACTEDETKFVKVFRAKRIYPATGPEDNGTEIYYNEVDEVPRYPWSYYHLDNCTPGEVVVRSTFTAIEQEFINAIEVPYGAGRIVLHATPMLFTNYHLRNEKVLQHAEKLLAFTGSDALIYYDPKSYTESEPNRPMVTESPLRFILANEALRWSWYLLLALAFVFLLTSTRRIQRPVPVISPPPNEALTYIDVVYRMYKKNGRHNHLVQVQHKLLMHFLRMRYGISAGNADRTFIREASLRLQMEEAYINQFFTDLDHSRYNSTLTDQELQATDLKIREFYQKCP